MAGLGLPVSVPLFWWLAQAPAQAEPEHRAVSCDDVPADDDRTGAVLWQGPPLATMPAPVRDISIVAVEPVDPAPEPDEDPPPDGTDPDPASGPDQAVAFIQEEPAPDHMDRDDVEDDREDGAGPDSEPDLDEIVPRVGEDMVGGVGPAARQIKDDWRMDGADLGVPVDLGTNAKGERVIGYVFGDSTSRIQPFSHGGPDLDLRPGLVTWANPILYTHLDQDGDEIVDGFADENDIPAYPAWSTRWVGGALQAAGAGPEPEPYPGRKGMPIDLLGRIAAAGTPGGSMLEVVRSVGGKAKGPVAASIVPTSAIVVDDKLFVAFQIANNWDVSAQWTTLQSQIVQFDLDPDTRRVIPPIPELPAPALVLTNPHGQRPASKPKTWNRGAPFQQMEFAMVEPPDGSPPVVYIGGQQEGRANDGLHMARSAPHDLLDPDRWEYYTAAGWRRPGQSKTLSTLPVTPPLPSVALQRPKSARDGQQDGIGESGLMQFGPYLAFVYTRNMQTPVAMRLAPLDHPTEFGPELAVVTGDGRDRSLRDPRGVYGGFLSAARSEDDALVATISHWGGYGTYQVRIMLNQPLGETPLLD
ncbi:DUF4185 domain-containing protein [Segniliparus rotundus]|uniref:DUF4185 domain-containing protein n=1 Tax=Segniliparus rotundus TaxID=286802 RepID=UPI0002D88D7C|nr:DUF4185 domain-containing protein [Segniliparus rotundus]